MDSRARAREILDYLATNEVAGTTYFVHHQLELFRDADWSVDTTIRRIEDYHAVGYLDYLPDRGKGFYLVTDAGRQANEDGLTDEQLDSIIGIAQDS